MKEQLGHASIKMTVDTYGHLMPSMQRGVVDGLDDIGNVAQTSPGPMDNDREE